MIVNLKLKEFISLFTTKEQYIRVYDLANEDEILFEDQIGKLPETYFNRRIILFETMCESDFDGYLGVYIATKNEGKYYEYYNDLDEEETIEKENVDTNEIEYCENKIYWNEDAYEDYD